MRLILALLLCVITIPAFASDLETSAKQAIVMDYDTGMVLYEKNADEQMPTSSMSKVMTIYMVFDALKKGAIKLDDTFSVSEQAWRMQGSKMFVDVNSQVSVEDLIRGVVIQSGNDATIVLAEGLSGSEISFANAMTKRAHELGMKNTNFVNASGWPDPQHYSTARDLAVLGKALIRDFPEYYHYYSEKEFTYNDIKQGNRNPLLYRNIGADGIKTGHTELAGYGLIGSAKVDDRRVIVVINGTDSMQARADESAKLLEWGLRSFENKTLLTADTVVGEADVVFGKSETVPLAVTQDIKLTLPKLAGADLKMEVVYNGPIKAPIAKGDEIGKLLVHMPKSDVVNEYPLVAAQDVTKLGFFSQTLAKAKQVLAGGA